MGRQKLNGNPASWIHKYFCQRSLEHYVEKRFKVLLIGPNAYEYLENLHRKCYSNHHVSWYQITSWRCFKGNKSLLKKPFLDKKCLKKLRLLKTYHTFQKSSRKPQKKPRRSSPFEHSTRQPLVSISRGSFHRNRSS